MKKTILIIGLLITVNQMFASKTDTLKNNKIDVLIGSNTDIIFKNKDNYLGQYNLQPGILLGVFRNVINKSSFSYSIGAKISNNNGQFINTRLPSSNIDYSVYTYSKIDDKTYYNTLHLQVIPIHLSFNIYKEKLFVNYSLIADKRLLFSQRKEYYYDNELILKENYSYFDKYFYIPESFKISQSIGLSFKNNYFDKYIISIAPELVFFFSPTKRDFEVNHEYINDIVQFNFNIIFHI